MPKNIIFCADGTWNGPDEDEDKDGVPDNTNVLKLFFNLAGQDTLESYRLADEQERRDDTVPQIAKYLHGVGDSNNWLKKMVGGGFGAGVISRIVRGYTFISRYYQPGDDLFLIGFSRGAYTARALGGLIAARGLLNPARVRFDRKEEAYAMAAKAWRMHWSTLSHPSVLERLATTFSSLPALFAGTLTDADFVPATIKGIGVWDTVGAMGIPVFLNGEQQDLFRFTDTVLHPGVKNGLHLVSVDERRGDFAPTLWEARVGVQQILMPGAHADVGGGYPVKDGQSALSDIALACMMAWCAGLGVRFANPPAVMPAPHARGLAHQPWNEMPFTLLPQSSRRFPGHLQLHQAVLNRWQANEVPQQGENPAPYRPDTLEAFCSADGKPLPGVTVVASCRA